MNHQMTPSGIIIQSHGKALRGICPNGMVVIIRAEPALCTQARLGMMNGTTLAQVDQGMLAVIQFFTGKAVVNAT